MQVRYTARAQKQVRRLSPAISGAIIAKIEQYAADPPSLANNVKALKDRPECSLRVGDYRVLFVLSEDGAITIMTVTAVGHRGWIYD